MTDCYNILPDNFTYTTTSPFVAAGNLGAYAEIGLHGIDLCWEDFARPGEVEAWSAFETMTPEALADRLYRLCTGRDTQVEEGDGPSDRSSATQDDEIMTRCLMAARSALDDLFDEMTAEVPGVPIETPVPVAAIAVFEEVHRFVLTKLDRYYMAAGGIGRAEIAAMGRRSEAAAWRAVGSLLRESGLRALQAETHNTNNETFK